MGELINKHTIKIQFTAALIMIGFVIYWTFIGTGYDNKVDVQEQTLIEIKPKVEKIPVIESNIQGIKDDVSEMKQDIKTLIKR